MLSSIRNLATTYNRWGWWMDAEPLEMKIMETNVRVLHPAMLASMHNLASTWACLGCYVDVVALMEKCAQVWAHVLGLEHPPTLES